MIIFNHMTFGISLKAGVAYRIDGSTHRLVERQPSSLRVVKFYYPNCFVKGVCAHPERSSKKFDDKNLKKIGSYLKEI